METLSGKFREQIKKVVVQAKTATHITEDNVYQEGDRSLFPHLDEMVGALVLPASGVDGMENLTELFSLARAGKSCLLLPEHYSNLDLSLFSYLVRKSGDAGGEIERAVIAIAGMKLNEESPVVAAFASAYTRIVIYPSRSLAGLDGENEEHRAEFQRAKTINHAAMKAVIRHKYKGRLVLIFPSGTRYRPGDPSTKRGVREIDSYIRSFDYLCFVAINGEVMHIRPGDMMDDAVSQDIVRLSVSPVVSCAAFRDKARAADAEDKKQAVADAVMAELETMHREGEERRKRLLSAG